MNGSPNRPLAPSAPNGKPVFEHVHIRQSRTQKSTACEACRSRKIKCVGRQPCDYCTRTDSECIIDEGRDGRRKISLKRTIDELERDRDLLLNLVSSMRHGKNIYITQLLNLIKSDASLDDIRFHLDTHLAAANLERTPELERVQCETQPQKKAMVRKAMDVGRLVDIPVFNVPAKPWTAVTDDDSLVSHLISLWFTWNHPIFNYVHREAFIKDMQAGELQCRFCSRFLVNAILAKASALCDYPEVYAVPGDPSSRGVMFLEEAKSLLGKIEDFSSLPTIQGLTALSILMAMVGKDRQGWMYVGLAKRSAEEYEKAVAKPRVREPEEVVRYTLWGNFNVMTAYSVSLNKYEHISRPLCPRPSLSHGASWNVWSPYPRSAETVPACLSCISNGWADLMSIMVETGQWMTRDERSTKEDAIKEANAFRGQLQAWKRDLPSCIQPDSESTPQVLYLHMQYHTIVMQLFGVLRQQGIHELETQETRVSAAYRVLELVRIHRSKWGTKQMSPTMMHWISVSLFTLLEALDKDQNRAAFTELCVVMRSCSRRWMLSKGILRMVQLNAAKMQVALPEKSRALFIDFAKNDWRDEDRGLFSSLYPNFGAEQNDVERDEGEMDKFLRKWDHLAPAD